MRRGVRASARADRSVRPASRRTNYSPACTASRRSPSAGCSEPTKAASSPGTCRRTWTSSPSASTADDHEPEGCSSTDCSNKHCRPLLAHTARSSSIPAQGGAACYPRRPTNACAQPVSTAIRWIARGASLRGDPSSSDVAPGLAGRHAENPPLPSSSRSHGGRTSDRDGAPPRPPSGQCRHVIDADRRRHERRERLRADPQRDPAGLQQGLSAVHVQVRGLGHRRRHPEAPRTGPEDRAR